ncbi:uncharacterized protein BX664DRAFT_331911 [Halteromyces radiatus]|uniref:uncharacterized protein n=1 Tax=Halteromyces radiatus TaxID=101107 RepID=UPI00221F6F68|nr:uncharacterized protein BX664DRAFT_331911 [Halteromyces radiatus]KAI8088987.1 hypothetical protein BX664DRAFT_331911 [Halteromyces radiatus]
MTKDYHTSTFEAEVLDNTLLSIPDVYTDYIHPQLILVLHYLVTICSYCLYALVKIIYVAVLTILWPVYLICSFFILRPLYYFYHLCQLLYPVAIYLGVAVICGIIIGGCAGFTAEALSSIILNATWGPSTTTTTTTVDKVYLDTNDMDDLTDDGNSFEDWNDLYNDITQQEEETMSWKKEETDDDDDDHPKKGKQAMLRRPSMNTNKNSIKYRPIKIKQSYDSE